MREGGLMERTTRCVVGGGPAGMMLGLLLARAGVDVTVLEKHGDFLRDFRGDTVHPSTLRLLDELGLGGTLRAAAVRPAGGHADPHRRRDRHGGPSAAHPRPAQSPPVIRSGRYGSR
ncbi:FAD-dependent monooxygenase [Streptomyces avermitilis]|uniref:FAD-dependent monooxygenase n=1 Tax=Streptomyces avermitilis TaxID=33903 RepID=UPI00367AAF0B